MRRSYNRIPIQHCLSGRDEDMRHVARRTAPLVTAHMNSLQTPPTICVTGGSGFIGTHLVRSLQCRNAAIRVLTRSRAPAAQHAVQVCTGDLFDPASLDRFLHGAEILINLAQPSEALDDHRFIEAMDNLAQAAVRGGVRRVLHLSTAMVVGTPRSSYVDEQSPCHPQTRYERQKHAAELALHRTLDSAADFGVLRPTAVFGAGGQNLLKLCRIIMDAPSLQRQALRLFHGRRHMHLVSVEDVIEAILFLTLGSRALAGNTFLISSDHEPDNNYQAVDNILAQALGKTAGWNLPGIPRQAFRGILHLLGRSQTDPDLIYDSGKIRSWGFVHGPGFADALATFAADFARTRRPQ